jgi:hypothetical protein
LGVFSVRGVKKHPQKVHVTFSTMVWVYRVFSLFLSDGSSKIPQKQITKTSSRRPYGKKIDHKINAVFFPQFCFIAFLGVSRRWESENTTHKTPKNVWPCHLFGI